MCAHIHDVGSSEEHEDTAWSGHAQRRNRWRVRAVLVRCVYIYVHVYLCFGESKSLVNIWESFRLRRSFPEICDQEARRDEIEKKEMGDDN